ncbi:MAG: hypothetical protein GY742_10850 [Hyphomicrobiales bacterium]|nr:hypothetical protein [Hyphomicrobiales bacterium]
MLERLDFKTVRFDKLADTILVNGKKIVVEISRDALEALYRREFTGEEAVIKAVEESKRLNHLANMIPADDGKIHITAALMLGNGQFSQLHANKTGD